MDDTIEFEKAFVECLLVLLGYVSLLVETQLFQSVLYPRAFVF
jgi:hypothetical protein